MPYDRGTVTELLKAWTAGDPAALERLMTLVVDDLRTIARQLLRGEIDNQTLQPTELVNELYIRLVGKRSVRWENSRHFFGEMTRMLRRMLIDRARNRKRQKRGGGVRPAPLLEELQVPIARREPWLEDLDAALDALARHSERQAEMIQLHYFVGLSAEEISAVLAVSERTVKREVSTARLWLYREMTRGTVSETQG
ncbi:MAG TPA: ECF-type sigma factor [Thermoanaerobaculia bacterium]|nr:ECF-type sigma factor [Thermoanaerobaculia bacterium]